MPENAALADREVLFLNLTVQDGTAAVKARVEKHLSKLPKPLMKQAARRASCFATPGMVAQYLSQRMIMKLPRKMKEKGVTVELEEVFREGPYVVLKLDVIHVDPIVLTSSKQNPDETDTISGMVQWFLEAMGENFQKTIEEEYLPRHIMTTLERDMPVLLADHMNSKMLEAQTKVLSNRETQKEYFSGKLKELRRQESVRQSLMRIMRRRIHNISSEDGYFQKMKTEHNRANVFSE